MKRRAILATCAAESVATLAAACGAAGGPAMPAYSGGAAQIRVQGGIGNNPGLGDHWDEAMVEFKSKYPRINATREPNPHTTDSGAVRRK